MSAHPDLNPLLVRHGVTWPLFSKKGRLSKELKWVKAKRAAIVTELHAAGTPWLEMCEITGFSLGTINRLSGACWNERSRMNRRMSAARVGHSLKGRAKPWLSKLMKSAWRDGRFDFHFGRVRTKRERRILREASQRPEVRAKRSASAIKRWANSKQRRRLLSFHRSPEQRRIRSEAQAKRMQEDPSKWVRGRAKMKETVKCTRPDVYTRSSYERRMIDLLDNDPLVAGYEFEPLFRDSLGRFFPDFVVTATDGGVTLIEVKASWVFALPKRHKVWRRLKRARDYAVARGWGFDVFTEHELCLTRKKKSA